MTVTAKVCRHCGQRIRPHLGTWVHRDTGSLWCDLSGDVRAAP